VQINLFRCEEEIERGKALLVATMATPWLTGAGAVGHMRIREAVDAHVAAQEREIAIGFVKGANE
jgi:hypothetical protein